MPYYKICGGNKEHHGKGGRHITNQWMEWWLLKNNNPMDRQQVFSCGLWYHAHVGPGGVSAPQACAHSSACTLVLGQFQQTYLWVTTDAASAACKRRNWRKRGKVVAGEWNTKTWVKTRVLCQVLQKTGISNLHEHYHLLESEFCVAGGARETTDTPGLVESGHHWEGHRRKTRKNENI